MLRWVKQIIYIHIILFIAIIFVLFICRAACADDDRTLQDLQIQSEIKVEGLLKDPAFQSFITTAQGKASCASGPQKLSTMTSGQEPSINTPSDLYVFVSFSLGKTALLNLALDAKRYGATLVLRGFKDGSYLKTVQALQKIIWKSGQGVIVDPELFTLFNVTAVPTIVLAKPFQLAALERTQTPLHDRLMGHVSLHYALEKFAELGDLQQEAQSVLQKGTAQ